MNQILEPYAQRLVSDSPWFALVASDPDDITDKIFVTIQGFDKKLQFGPCRWQSRDAVSLPSRGDKCLVVFDNRRHPWVVAWWPKEYPDNIR